MGDEGLERLAVSSNVANGSGEEGTRSGAEIGAPLPSAALIDPELAELASVFPLNGDCWTISAC